MNYTLAQLHRVAPRRQGILLWRARLGRVWKVYVRLMSAIAGAMGAVMLTLQYFILLPPFAFLARRAERREPQGWIAIPPEKPRPLESQY